jgi:hypothetical protein
MYGTVRNRSHVGRDPIGATGTAPLGDDGGDRLLNDQVRVLLERQSLLDEHS